MSIGGGNATLAAWQDAHVRDSALSERLCGFGISALRCIGLLRETLPRTAACRASTA
jgi:hypothetical protein